MVQITIIRLSLYLILAYIVALRLMSVVIF